MRFIYITLYTSSINTAHYTLHCIAVPCVAAHTLPRLVALRYMTLPCMVGPKPEELAMSFSPTRHRRSADRLAATHHKTGGHVEYVVVADTATVFLSPLLQTMLIYSDVHTGLSVWPRSP